MGWRAWCLVILVAPLGAQNIPAPAREAYAQGATYKSIGRLVEANAQLEQAVRLYPKYREAWWSLAWVRTGLHRDEKALEAFRKTLALMSQDDPRRPKAKAWIKALEARVAAARVRATERALPRARAPVAQTGQRFTDWLRGWPLTLLSLLLAAGLAGAGRAVQAARRAGGGDPRAAGGLLRLADHADLAALPRSDFVAPLEAGAARAVAVREVLASAVREREGRARIVAAEALSRQGEQPDPTIWIGLLHGGQDLRRAALEGLSHAADPEALAVLAEVARGREPDDAVRAVHGLAGLEDQDALVALVTVCEVGRSREARIAAAEALAARPALPASLAEPLAALVANPDTAVRPWLVGALAATGETGRAALATLRSDPEPEVAAAAERALKEA